MIYIPATKTTGRSKQLVLLVKKPYIPEAHAPGAPKSDVIACPEFIKRFQHLNYLQLYPFIIYIILRQKI